MSDAIEVIDRRGFWFRIDNAVIEQYGKQIGAYGIAVYAALAYYGARHERGAFPKQQTIAELTGIGRTKVNQTLTELETAGLITSEQLPQYNGNVGTKRYYLSRVHDTNTGCSPHEQLNKNKEQEHTTYGAVPAATSQEGSPIVSPQAPTNAGEVHNEYERLQFLGLGLRDTALTLIRFATGLKTEKGKQDTRAVAAALGIIYRLLYGDRYEPEYSRLFKLARQHGGAERLVTVMLDTASREVLGDPHDILTKWQSKWKRQEAQAPAISNAMSAWNAQDGYSSSDDPLEQ